MVLLKEFSEFYKNLIRNVDDWKNRDDHESDLSNVLKATRAYNINSTGDLCAGDKILFVDRVWDKISVGRYGKNVNTIVDYKLVEAEIIKESYGNKSGQHTFTLLIDGYKRLIKGRNLYAVGCWRKRWPDESVREDVLNDKHLRGRSARNHKYRELY